MSRDPDRDQYKEIMHGFALISQVGLIMVACILGGFLLGLWLAGIIGAIAGTLLGVAAGMLNCYRILITPGPVLRSKEESESMPEEDPQDRNPGQKN